jgi:hypothetical protein
MTKAKLQIDGRKVYLIKASYFTDGDVLTGMAYLDRDTALCHVDKFHKIKVAYLTTKKPKR